MDAGVVALSNESKKDNDTPTEPMVRKGRRGLARKKTAETVTQGVSSSTTTTHHTSVYSSCVSRGFHQSMLGELSSVQEKRNDKSDDDNDIIPVNDCITEPKQNTDAMDELHQEVAGINANEEQREIMSIIDDSSDEEEETGTSHAVDPESLRSPTPPPTSQGLSQHKKRRMNRKLTSALKTLNKAKGNLNVPPISTPFTKARRKKGIWSNFVDNSPTTSLDDISPVKTEMIVKVRYLSNVHRMQLKLTDQFHNLLTHLSEETGQEEKHLSLYLNDQVLPLSRTPKEVGLTVADIIECHCIKDAKGGGHGNESITLLIQCSNSKRKTEINVTQRQPFKEILEKYAEQVGITALSFSFCFDGDDVGPNDTPLTLDMEDGDILDLVPATKPGARSRSAWQNSVVTII